MGIYLKFTITTHQIWLCHVTLASNSENFYFLPNSTLKFRKSYQTWGKLAHEQKSYRQKQIEEWKTPPPPSPSLAYRVNIRRIQAIQDHTSTLNGFKACFSFIKLYKT